MQAENLKEIDNLKYYQLSIPTPKTKKDLAKIFASSDFDLLRESSERPFPNNILGSFWS